MKRLFTTIIIIPLFFIASLKACGPLEERKQVSSLNLLEKKGKKYLIWTYNDRYKPLGISQDQEIQEQKNASASEDFELLHTFSSSNNKSSYDEQNARENSLKFMIYHPSTSEDPEKELRRLKEKNLIVFFEEDGISQPKLMNFEPLADTFKRTMLRAPEENWWFEAIECSPALELQKELSQISLIPIIAVLDSGIDYNHSHLADYIWENPIPGSFGCKNDQFGCDTAESELRGSPLPYGLKAQGQNCYDLKKQGEQMSCNHGTHLAGIIAAIAKDGFSAALPPYKILNLRVVSDSNGTIKVEDSAILRALSYLDRIKSKGFPLKVVNLSFGKNQRSMSLSFMISHLSNKYSDLLFVAAAGNEDEQRPFYPAAEDQVLAVTAINKEKQKASYANYGTWVDLSAPGGDQSSSGGRGIYSSIPGNRFAFSKGTSMAAPFVSAVAAIVAAREPSWSANDIKQFLKNESQQSIYNDEKNHSFQPIIFPENKKKLLLGDGLLSVSFLFSKKNKPKNKILSEQKNSTERIENQCASLLQHHELKQVPEGFILYFFLIPLILAISYVVSHIHRF